jgi:Flp pilus assembly pilin Flp
MRWRDTSGAATAEHVGITMLVALLLIAGIGVEKLLRWR